MSSIVYDYGLCCSKSGCEWYFMPGALLLDIGKLPFLFAGDVCYQVYDHALIPLSNAAGAAFNLMPKEILECLGKALVFVVPAAMLALGGYCCYTIMSGGSLIEGAKHVAASIPDFISPTLFVGLIAGTCIGSAFSKARE